jgi:hypothetical protein
VFPIPEQGERTIRLKFSAPVHATRGLSFPLSTDAAVGQFRFTLNSTALATHPEIGLPGVLRPDWQDLRYSARAVASQYAKPLSGTLHIGPVRPLHTALSSFHANGERRVHIADQVSRVDAAGETGRRLRVYWDRSLSRRDQQLTLERQLLARHLAQSRPASIDVVLFNSSGATVRRVSALQADALLAGVTYRGATSFAVLDKLKPPAADQCLIFTDGVATIDARPRFEPGCEVFALTSAVDADRGFLRRLTGGNAAAVLQVGEQAEHEMLARLRGAGPRVVGVFGEDGRGLDFAALDGGEKGWSVITDAPSTGVIVVHIAGIHGRVEQRRYSPRLARRLAFAGAGALWAANEVNELAADDATHEQFLALSRKYSVASPQLSFLVLETAEDYVAAGIAPAANSTKEFMAEYRELQNVRDARQKELRQVRIDEVRERWQEVVDWWRTPFDPMAKKKAVGPEKRALAQAASAAAPAMRQREAMQIVDSIAAEDVGGVDEIMVTGTRAVRHSSLNALRGTDVARTIDVAIAEWDVERPYIAALDAATPTTMEKVFAAQEREFGGLPAFYFDVAEWLRRQGREADAEEMLLSALELPVANEQTVAMVADRLQRHGGLERAVWLLERAARQTDYLPQPRRALALALAKRAAPGDLERAVTLLNEVIMTPWEGEFDGIEVVALMEINTLLPRLKEQGVRKIPLDERLRGLLDVDLRVVIEWNTVATDMDLWVDEPNGERAIFSNPLTAIGGRLSNDMTEGFGPEEYLLRRSATGEYRISVNVYDTDGINPNGSTVVTARLFRDFGRPNQSEQTMEIELLPGDKGEKLIGGFTVR